MARARGRHANSLTDSTLHLWIAPDVETERLVEALGKRMAALEEEPGVAGVGRGLGEPAGGDGGLRPALGMSRM